MKISQFLNSILLAIEILFTLYALNVLIPSDWSHKTSAKTETSQSHLEKKTICMEHGKYKYVFDSSALGDEWSIDLIE